MEVSMIATREDHALPDWRWYPTAHSPLSEHPADHKCPRLSLRRPIIATGTRRSRHNSETRMWCVPACKAVSLSRKAA